MKIIQSIEVHVANSKKKILLESEYMEILYNLCEVVAQCTLLKKIAKYMKSLNIRNEKIAFINTLGSANAFECSRLLVKHLIKTLVAFFPGPLALQMSCFYVKRVKDHL